MVLDSLPLAQISTATDILFDCYQASRTAYFFGNGGSAALASHLATDIGKGTHVPGPGHLESVKRMKAFAVTDSIPLITAWANDSHYEDIFMRQIENFIEPGDVAFGISGSGNSRNVVKALEYARKIGATTIGLGGCGGGKMKDLLDCAIIVPSDSIQQVEDAHLAIGHMIYLNLRSRMIALAETIAEGA